METAAQPLIRFGPFCLYSRQRLLLEGDVQVRLGSRALDILIILVERAGELVTKQELAARVWPGIHVDPSNLKVNVAALRRVLRDDQSGNRYICTVTGRGYSFVAPIERLPLSVPNPAGEGSPTGTAPVVGDSMWKLFAQLLQQQFIAVLDVDDEDIRATANFLNDCQCPVQTIDLSELRDPCSLPKVVATAVGLEICSADSLGEIATFMEGKNMLLLLDHCRHVIEATASFGGSILARARGVQILAINR
jgi:DNA-binding winged helix-turn-helix (wHTH) protein